MKAGIVWSFPWRVVACEERLRPEAEALLAEFSEVVGDRTEAAAILFEASVLIDNDWKPSSRLRSLRSLAMAEGWVKRTADLALERLMHEFLDEADSTFAKTGKARRRRSLAPGALSSA